MLELPTKLPRRMKRRVRSTKRNIRPIDEKALANLARKLKLEYGDIDVNTEGQQCTLKELTDRIAEGPFRVELAKYPGNEPHLLMERVISYIFIDYIRTTHPKEEPTKTPEKEPSGKRQLTPAQQAQRARTIRHARPMAPTHAADTRRKGGPKGAPPKAVRRRDTYDDPRIVQDTFGELFQSNPDLMVMFCRASTNTAFKKLLRTNKRIGRVMKSLQREGVMACPTRVYTYAETAVRHLVAQHKSDLEAAQQAAEAAAAERREQERKAAIEASAKQVATLSAKEQRRTGKLPRRTRKVLAQIWA